MKIGVAQARPLAGDIQRNINNHIKLVQLAVAAGADMLIFPELSLTGYEPTLAAALAIEIGDSRLDDFQKISDAQHIIIGVGVPTRSAQGICISMILFRPGKARIVYSKKHLHSDEDPFFISGENVTLNIMDPAIALAICYEISVEAHAAAAAANGATVYIASVAKSEEGTEKALVRLAGIAQQYPMLVLYANCVGQADGEECGGKTSIIDERGGLLCQMNDVEEGILVVDTATRTVVEAIL